MEHADGGKQMKTKERRSERGMALIMSLVIVLLIMGLVASYMTVSATNTKLTAANRDTLQALFVAETGLAQAFHQLNAQGGTTDVGAFTDIGRAAIVARVAPEQRIAVDDKDAVRLAANTVCVGNVLVMPACSPRLRAILTKRGYRVAVTPLPAFLRSGGAAFCLTLRLDRRLGMVDAEQDAAVA